MAGAKKTNNSDENIKKISKQLEIKKEITKINRLYKDMDPAIKKAIQPQVEEAAWMIVTLKELRTEMDLNGLIVEYQNGEFQSGTKKSPEVDIYNTMIKNFNSTLKAITDLLPKGNNVKDDGFDEFVMNK